MSKIHKKIGAFNRELIGDPNHRYRSWEHCYQFFSQLGRSKLCRHRDLAALHLGFYLASWGMYRGSGFLLGRAYTIHLAVVDCLAAPQLSGLWRPDIGVDAADVALIPMILRAVEGIKQAYTPSRATDTLASKVILGTLGCLPACDRYFIKGFRREGLSYSALNDAFLSRVFDFCRKHSHELQAEQANIKSRCGVQYPAMKLVDMYFWQSGYEADKTSAKALWDGEHEGR